MISTMLCTLIAAQAVPQYTEKTPTVDDGVRYELLEGSTLTDLHDLGPGDPVHPVRGTFTLRLLPTAGPFPVYAVRGLRLRTLETPPVYTVHGSGFYRTLGTFPGGFQDMQLSVGIGDAHVVLESGLVPQEARFETIEIELSETPTTNDHLFVLHLIAEPPHAVSFSTGVELTSGIHGPVSAGDLLSSSGHVLRTNHELTALLGLMPIAPDIGLDAVGRTPATETIVFSGEVDVFSETLGLLQHGDLLSSGGFVLQTNQELTAKFGPMPIVPDAGLDAFHADLATGELWFSLEDPLFSEVLGITLDPGDLLSSAGYVVRTNAQLLERFHIVSPDPNGYGLDAVTVLPNGTILFSVEQGFVDARFGPVGHGDLLSDNGHIVRRNLQLVWPFQPVEDLDDFGLDALQIVGN